MTAESIAREIVLSWRKHKKEHRLERDIAAAIAAEKGARIRAESAAAKATRNRQEVEREVAKAFSRLRHMIPDDGDEMDEP